MNNIRQPAVAGQFYPMSTAELKAQLKLFIGISVGSEDAIGIVSPHAGYIFSGSVAASVFSITRPKSVYVILGPNHTGLGEAFSLTRSTFWKTPLGDVKINAPLAKAMMEASPRIKEDERAHMSEHSIEVQLPFLQYRQKGSFTFVPVVVSHAAPEDYRDVGLAIARAAKGLGLADDLVIIASSDMTHYESQEAAVKKDSAAIEAILALDASRLLRTVSRMDISMCGYAPTAVMINAVKELGANNARLVKYQTSGDASGDYSSVVGYAGVIITKG